MFTDPCSHSPSLLFQGKHRASGFPCTDFLWSSDFCQNCSYFSPACSILLLKLGQESPFCQTSHPLSLHSRPAQAACHGGHVAAAGSVQLCFSRQREQSSPELAAPEMSTLSLRSPPAPKQPLTLRSTSCACKAVTWEFTDWPMGIREHSSAYCFTQK